jgi:Ca2+-binding RTX toxin-like protein
MGEPLNPTDGATGIDNRDGGLGADIINGDADNDTLTGPTAHPASSVQRRPRRVG